MREGSETTLHQAVLSAWQDELRIARDLTVKQRCLAPEPELLSRVAAHYQRLKALSRPVRRRLQRYWKRSLAGVALLLALGATPALASTINVSGSCTLVNAINAANNAGNAGGACARGSTGADTIVLPTRSTQNLTRIGNATLYGPTGLPTISSAITINGNGSTIRRTRSAPAFRIFAVGNSGDLTLVNTTVSGGRAVRAGSSAPDADVGGGVFVYQGALTLTNATISGNTASEDGGGVYAYHGAVNVTNSRISNNRSTADYSGGGMDANHSEITITHSIISGNIGSGVEGIYNPVEITDSTISDNSGGGLIDRSAESYAGGLTVTRSTISGNSGDGLYAASNSINITNSTISGNEQGITGGKEEGLALKLTHSTIASNTRGGIVAYAGEYGTDIILARSMISGNAEREVSAAGENISVSANNFNIFGHSGSAGVEGFSPGPIDIVPTEPLDAILSPSLADNGGSTKTHALVAGSPAIDTVFDGTLGCSLSEDQRGIRRPQDGDGDGVAVCDTGAVEQAGLPGVPSTSVLPDAPPAILQPAPSGASDPLGSLLPRPTPEAPLSPPLGEPPPGVLPPPPPPTLAPPPPVGEQPPPPIEQPPPVGEPAPPLPGEQPPPVEEPPPPPPDEGQPPPDDGSSSGAPPQESLAPGSPPASEESSPSAPEQSTKWGVSPF